MIATNGSCPHKDDLSDTIAPLTGVPKSYSFERKPFDIGSRRHFNTTITRALHARLLHKLAVLGRRHPDMAIIHAPNEVIMPAPSRHGFPIAIVTRAGRYTLHLGDWWDDFAQPEEVVALIDEAMHGYLRLKVVVDNDVRTSTLERQLPDGNWLEQPRRVVTGQTHSSIAMPYAVYHHNNFQPITWPQRPYVEPLFSARERPA